MGSDRVGLRLLGTVELNRVSDEAIVTFGEVLASGQKLVATATDAAGNTSEFSLAFGVP